MKNQLWQLSVSTSIEAEEAVAALLEEIFGQASVGYADAASQTAAVSIYCPKPPKLRNQMGYSDRLLGNENVAYYFSEFVRPHFFLFKFVGNPLDYFPFLWYILLMLYTTILKSVVWT